MLDLSLSQAGGSKMCFKKKARVHFLKHKENNEAGDLITHAAK